MKTIGAVVTALLIFVFVWLLIAMLLVTLAWAATNAGVRPGLFIWFNYFFIWIICPGVSAAISIYSVTLKFQSVDSKSIFVSFVTVFSCILSLGIVYQLVNFLNDEGSFWPPVIFAAQIGMIFGGAKLGSISGKPKLVTT